MSDTRSQLIQLYCAKQLTSSWPSCCVSHARLLRRGGVQESSFSVELRQTTDFFLAFIMRLAGLLHARLLGCLLRDYRGRHFLILLLQNFGKKLLHQ